MQNYLSHAFFNELVIQWSGKQSKTRCKKTACWLKGKSPRTKAKIQTNKFKFVLHVAQNNVNTTKTAVFVLWLWPCYTKNLWFTFTIGLPSTCRACLCIFCRKIRCLSIGIWWTLHCAISYKWLSYSVCRKQKTAKLLENTSRLIHLPQMVWNWDTIYKISYDNLTIMPKLRSTYNGRLIYKTSYEEHKAFLRYDSLAKS